MDRKDYELIELTDCAGHDGAIIQLPPGLVVVSPEHGGFAVANGAEITVSVPTAEFERLVEEGALVATARDASEEPVAEASTCDAKP